MNVLALLLVTALTIPSPAVVLKNGTRIDVDGSIRVEAERVVFRANGGTLYSLPLAEVDLDATKTATVQPVIIAPAPQPDVKDAAPTPLPQRLGLKLRESERDRLLRDLEQNHNGKPATPQKSIDVVAPAETRDDRASAEDEWTWRRRAHEYEEAVIQARENLALLRRRVDELRRRIVMLTGLGYRPQQFTYDTTELQLAIDRMPYAELEVERAERAYAQFKEDARRMGIMPGWLR